MNLRVINAEWKKPVSKDYKLYGSIYRTLSKGTNYIDREQVSGALGEVGVTTQGQHKTGV